MSEVIVDHVTDSGAGGIYRDYESFVATLTEMLRDDRKLAQMGELGRDYVLARYTRERVRDALLEAVGSCRGRLRAGVTNLHVNPVKLFPRLAARFFQWAA